MSVVHTNYLVVKGSVYSNDCTIFGLEKNDEDQLLAQFHQSSQSAVNGKIYKAPVVTIINCLAKFGYKVVSSTGEAEPIWTLEARRTQPIAPQDPRPPILVHTSHTPASITH